MKKSNIVIEKVYKEVELSEKITDADNHLLSREELIKITPAAGLARYANMFIKEGYQNVRLIEYETLLKLDLLANANSFGKSVPYKWKAMFEMEKVNKE